MVKDRVGVAHAGQVTGAPRLMAFWRSLVGQKIIMAVTGIMLYAFLVEHLLGLLLIFLGPAKLNGYKWLLDGPLHEIIWAARVVLLVALLLHLIAAARVTLTHWRARPVGYLTRKDGETTYAARTMIVSGPLIFLFLGYHLMMFTFLTTGPGYSPTDDYRNIVLAFQVPTISVVYILAMLILGFHLWHAGWSMLQTLGITWPTRPALRRVLIPVLTVLITGGYLSIPLAVLAGLVR
jgi:succinate dehydrogenase / fumarate reductase cytochrome b subunit